MTKNGLHSKLFLIMRLNYIEMGYILSRKVVMILDQS